jgi:hypothetical protein
VTGQTSSSNFSVTANPYQKDLGGPSDAFVTKVGAIAFVTPTSLTFASQAVGTSSVAQTITLTHELSTALNPTIATSGDFKETNTCGTSLGPSLSCTISVTLAPTSAQARTGSLTITDNSANSPQTVTLSGAGTDFSLAAASGANCPSGGNCSTGATIKAGQTASYNLQVTPSNGFSGTVALTCGGAPMSATCSVSPASISVNGTASAFVVSLSNTSSVRVIPFVRLPVSPVEFGALVLPYLLASTLIVRKRIASKRLGRAPAPVRLLLVFIATWLIMSGCGGGSAPPTNTTLTITGTSNGVSRTLPINLTVNH